MGLCFVYRAGIFDFIPSTNRFGRNNKKHDGIRGELGWHLVEIAAAIEISGGFLMDSSHSMMV